MEEQSLVTIPVTLQPSQSIPGVVSKLTLTISALSGSTYTPEDDLGWQLLHCTVAINEVQYEYEGSASTFTTVSTRSAPLRTIKMVMAASDNPQMSSVVSGVVDTLFFSKDHATAYARQLSSVLLADSSIAFSPIQAAQVWHIEPRLGSQLRTLPLVLFLLLTALFWQVSIHLWYIVTNTSWQTLALSPSSSFLA